MKFAAAAAMLSGFSYVLGMYSEAFINSPAFGLIPALLIGAVVGGAFEEDEK